MEALILQWLQVTSLESIFGQVREESFSESLLIYIDIDAVSVLEFDMELGNWLLSANYQVKETVHRACLSLIDKEFPDLVSSLDSPEQIRIKLAFSSIPYSRESHMPNIASLCTYLNGWSPNSKHLHYPYLSFYGIVTRIHSIEQHIFSKTYQCIKCHSKHIVKHNVRDDFLFCPNCYASLQEIPSSRIMKSKPPPFSVLNKASQYILVNDAVPSQSIRPYILIKLTDSVSLGEEIHIIGSPCFSPISVDKMGRGFAKMYIKANNVFHKGGVVSANVEPWCFFPKKEIAKGPWELTQLVVDSFASEISPFQLFSNLKLAVILSVFSSMLSKKPIHLLIIGDHDPYPKRILDYAISLFGRKSLIQGKLSPQFKDNSISIEKYCFGIPCFISEMTKINKEDKSFLMEAMDKSEIVVPKSQSMKVDTSTTSIWGFSNKHFTGIDPGLLNRFNLLFHISPAIFDINVFQEPLPYHLLPSTELTSFLLYARDMPRPSMTEPARLLLQNYWLSSRKILGNVSIVTMETLCLLSENHAKLRLEPRIDVQDALIAIMLVEESTLVLTKKSVLGFQENKRNIEMYGNDIKTMYWEFYRHVLRFCEANTFVFEE